MEARPQPTPGSPEKHAVRSMFDRIAPRYDLLNHLLSAGVDRRWRRAAVELLDPREGARVLDLCAGTADLLIEAIARDGVSGAGLDLSEPMLARGLRKLARGGLSARAALACGDAERLPFRSASFDGALVAFGVRNLGRPDLALREAHRVLRPGGRLVILEFSMPRGALGVLYGAYFRHVLPRVGGLVSGDRGAYAYLPASVERFSKPAELGSLMGEAGFAPVSWKPLSFGIAHLHLGEKGN